MLTRVGLEVMNTTNPELSWKPVTKGRRSKIARSLISIAKEGNSVSPKKVGDLSGSDSDKCGEVIPGQGSFGKSENVPLKKRRHLLQSPSPHPWASSLHKQDFAPLRTHSSPLSEDRIQLQYPSCSSGDFSGIELLAAAAIKDDDIDDANEKDTDTLPADSSVQKNSDASSYAALSKQYPKNNESVDSFSNINAAGGKVYSQENTSSTASQSLSAGPADGTVPKVDRKHWDLNTSMDAWGEPHDDSIAGDTLKDVNGGRQMEEMEKHFGDHVQAAITDEKPSLKVEQDMSASVAEGVMCSEPPHFKENLLDPPTSIYYLTGRDTSNKACEEDPDDKNFIKAFARDADWKRLNQVASLDASDGRSSISMICSSSGMLKSEGENNAISGSVGMIQNGDCSSNMSECERTAALSGSYTRTYEVNAHDTGASGFLIDAKPEEIEVSQKTSSPGTFTIDAQPVAITESNKQIDGAFLSKSTVAECKQYLEVGELGTNQDEDCILLNEDSNRTVLVDTCKDFCAGAQCDEPTIVGRTGLALDGQCDPDVSRDNHVDMVNGDDLTGFQEGCDSPYEDGELRGSILYSWEDNEMENECVDYESDGRNGDGSDAAGYLGSETVEGGSEGSNGSQRSLSLKLSAEGKTKSAISKHHLKKHAVKTESDNIEIAGKGSNAGSGSTVEQCVEMPMDGKDGMKRLDHKNAVDVRATTHIGEYALKAVKGKLLSQIEGRSSAECTDGKDVFFIQHSRSRRFAGSYPRPERDISPDRYLYRYRTAAPSESDGVHQWTSWVSRKHYTTSYRGGQGRNNTRPRSKTGESRNKIHGVDSHDPRQTNYLSKGLHRPLMRRSPVERDDYFGVDRRLPITREMGNYKSRGQFSQHPGRDFVENFEPLPVNAGASVRMRRYVSRRERSFSPGSGRQMHKTLPRRRSRSRSRTRSPPRAWQNSHRDRILGARRLSRSPDFRSDARMERMRVPFSKPTFTSDYGEGCISPSRGRFSPQQNCRWVEDRNFTDNHVMRKRSPVRVFRRAQRFDVGPSGRLKPDEYFRPVIRPGRFPFMGNGGRECKLDSNYGDRRRDDGGNMRRFQHNTAGGDVFDTKNMIDEDDGIRGVGEAKDMAQSQGEREEDKKAYKI